MNWAVENCFTNQNQIDIFQKDFFLNVSNYSFFNTLNGLVELENLVEFIRYISAAWLQLKKNQSEVKVLFTQPSGQGKPKTLP